MNSNAAAADLDPVEHNIIGLGANLRKFLRLKQRHVLRFRSSKGMMHGIPFVFLRTPLEERKVGDPEEIPFRRARVRAGLALSRPTKQILDFGDPQPQAPKNFTSDFPFVGGEEDTVALLDS